MSTDDIEVEEIDLTVGPPGEPDVRPGDPLGQRLDDHQDVEDVADDLEREMAAEDELVDEVPWVTPSDVAELLELAGDGLNMVVGDEDVPDHWKFTEREKTRLAPPLAEYINRHPRLARLAAHAETASVAVVLIRYTIRNVNAGRMAAQSRELREERDVPQEQPSEADRGDGTPPGPPPGDSSPAPPSDTALGRFGWPAPVGPDD